MTLKSKDKNIIWTKLYFKQFYYEKIWIELWIKDPDPGDPRRPNPYPVISRIRVTQKDRIRIRNTGLRFNPINYFTLFSVRNSQFVIEKKYNY